MISNRLKTLFVAFSTGCLCSLAHGLDIKGEWIQGGMLIGQAEPGQKIEFAKRQVRVDDDGVFVIGLGRDAAPTANLVVVNEDGSRKSHSFPVRQREYNIQRIEGVPQRTVDPPSAEDLARIRRESQLTQKAKRQDLPRRDFLQPITWPLLGPITGVYGSQRVYNGNPGRPHLGVDVAQPTGASVVAPLTGVVSLAHDNMFYNGGTLVIDHGHGITTMFIHLSKILVEEGSEVQQGQIVAEVGATGRATGPHLDWRMNWFNHPLDPQILVEEMPAWQAEP